VPLHRSSQVGGSVAGTSLDAGASSTISSCCAGSSSVMSFCSCADSCARSSRCDCIVAASGTSGRLPNSGDTGRRARRSCPCLRAPRKASAHRACLRGIPPPRLERQVIERRFVGGGDGACGNVQAQFGRCARLSANFGSAPFALSGNADEPGAKSTYCASSAPWNKDASSLKARSRS
jgi:hypothetical protein